MASVRVAKLRRLINASRILYLQETADLARLNAETREIAVNAASAEEYLAANETELSFLVELGLARVGRLRRDLTEAQSRLDAQLEKATSAMAKTRVAENLLEAERDLIERSRTVRALEEVIDKAARRKFSLG